MNGRLLLPVPITNSLLCQIRARIPRLAGMAVPCLSCCAMLPEARTIGQGEPESRRNDQTGMGFFNLPGVD